MSIEKTKWSNDFGEWFRDTLMEAGVMDYRYPIKGCGVWLPYGFKIRKNILQILREMLDSTGHEETLFPLLIPETSLTKEAVHVKNFEEECFWVTHGGLTPLRVKYALRPTSETAIAPMLKLWIRSHTDLPLKLYQVVNIFRYETKTTRPILRMREVATFKEAHTTHATAEEAEEQVKEGIEIYKNFFDEMGVPYLVSKRPEWDTFAGAEYSIAFDMVCPDGRSLQIGTVHSLGQSFAKAFDITYETFEGKQEYVWQTCYGVSGRSIAAVLIAHGDDHGFVLPPKLAPIQVVIVAIPYKGVEKEINHVCEDVAAKLEAANIKVELDRRSDITPGAKFYYWELRGVPIRLEIGPRDVERDEVTVVVRNTLKKQRCKRKDVVTVVQDLMERIAKDLKRKAWQWMDRQVHRVDSIEEAKRLLEEKAGVVEVLWCTKKECGLKLESETSARILGVPIDAEERVVEGKCLGCGQKATHLVRIAIAY